MTLTPLTALFQIEGQGLLYVAPDSVGDELPECRGWEVASLDAQGASIVPGPAIGSAVRLPVGAHGRSGWGLPVGSNACRMEIILRLGGEIDGLTELVGWGDDDATFALEYATTGKQLRAHVGAGVAIVVSADVQDGQWHHLGLQIDGGGIVAVYVDNAYTVADEPVPFPQASIAPRLRVAAGLDAAGIAVAPAVFNPGALADRYAVIQGSHMISGHAALVGGVAARAVAVRRVADRQTIAIASPATDSTFHIPVPAGLYEVACFGPEDFAAQIVDRVSAEAAV